MAIETLPTGVRIFIKEYICSKCFKDDYVIKHNGIKDESKYKYICKNCEHVEYIDESYPYLVSVLNYIEYKMEGTSVEGFLNIFKLNIKDL